MTEEKISVLIVDDRPEKLMALQSVIADLAEIVSANSGKKALRCLMQQEFAVILLDVNMPEMDGFETAGLIRKRESSEHTPIIFITSYSETETHASRGYSLGAVDYIHAPIIPEVVRAKVAVFVDLFKKTQQIKRQGDERVQLVREQTARALAEASERRANFLADASKALASSLDSLKVLQNLASLCVPYFADWTASQIVGTSGLIRLAGIAGTDEAQVQAARELDKSCPARTSDECGIARIIRSKSAEMVNHVDAAALATLACNRRHLEVLQSQHIKSYLAVPILSRRVQGILVFILSSSDRTFSPIDVALGQDLASRAAMAIENAYLYNEAEQANRAKDEFLAVVSHELRTPLTPILGWTRMLAQQQLNPAVIEKGIKVIERNVLAQTKLIEDLLDVSRIITGKLKLNASTVDLNTVIEMGIDSIRNAADAKNISIEVGSTAKEMFTQADPDRLQQVVWNLLTNSVKFTPSGGKITVRLKLRDEQLCLTVQDNGRGISAEFLPFVFERFRQADSTTTRTTGGLGIGLAIVRHIVELHGGTVTVQSKGEGQGAEFTVLLPIWNLPKMESQHRHGPVADVVVTHEAKLGGLKILLVEDDTDSRELLHTILAIQGASVTAVSNAKDALSQLDEGVPDILISDIGMANEDGFSLIKKVRARTAERGGEIPAIALTAYAKDEDRARALSAGFQQHIAKPVDPATLVAAVSSLASPVRN